MIELAKLFLKADKQQIKNLIEHYNGNCINYVKPARRYAMKYGDSWCGMFVSVMASLKGFSPSTFPYEVSVLEMVNIAVYRNQWRTGTQGIRRGDLIVYNWNGDFVPDHIGIVTGVLNDSINVIEGNKNNTVDYRTIEKDSDLILGYIEL